MNRPFLALTIALAAGCGSPAQPRDRANESFLVRGKADTGGVVDGTPEARGVLRLVNQATYPLLTDDVGVSEEAAENIVAYRVGDDHLEGTTDDATFTTLAELDAVPFVGPRTFAALLAWAQAHGYDAPAPAPPAEGDDLFDPTICTGDLMTMDQAKTRLGGNWAAIGTDGVTLGPVTMVGRSHRCDLNGCGAWSPASSLWLFERDGGGLSDFTLALPDTGRARVYSAGRVYIDLNGPVTAGNGGERPGSFECDVGGTACTLYGGSAGAVFLDRGYFSARVTDSCLLIDGVGRSDSDGAGRYTETEVVVYGSY